jgi:hypothetical protein
LHKLKQEELADVLLVMLNWKSLMAKNSSISCGALTRRGVPNWPYNADLTKARRPSSRFGFGALIGRGNECHPFKCSLHLHTFM